MAVSNEPHSVTGKQDDPDADQHAVEISMRRALGLGSSINGTATRRPVSPVITHRGSRTFAAPGNRGATAQASVAPERLGLEHTEAMLRTADAALFEAETRRGHAELERDEALAALVSERAARAAVEEQLRRLTAASPSPPAASTRKPGRPAGSSASNKPTAGDAPVRWWVPGWKARFEGRG